MFVGQLSKQWPIKKPHMLLEQLYILMEKVDAEPYFTPYIKIYLRWILDLSIKAKTRKLLEENTLWLGVGKSFLSRSQKPWKKKLIRLHQN